MISIAIPVLNEADGIKDQLSYLLTACSPENISEIIVVDGGSTDNTSEIVAQFINQKVWPLKFRLLTSERGRAKQMNVGANEATGDILYFLHADSFPPMEFDTFILEQVEKGNRAGCFQMKFDSNHWWLRLAGWLTRFRWRACRGGDQSQYITKELFDEIGGFDERYTIYEDNILINELYRRNEFVVIRNSLTTSCRLYRKKGIWRLQYHFWAIYVKKFFGADADELYRYYKKNIAS
ncbi:TIGR04283 family arsenosugar biosynthesis glycosyltransferase [Aureisphaera galaxeae]|uniref:TIGR04283 family arsenosugar biosynthesis glycosyltransferase n=1 Tax=Aureisphaera galaxeae TaxID=1538023 RepID=UPI00234FBD95|nr:TIGR04283 family arsenosugar biosynthesis glycosyltransferase [Aureisphaera galaxeae]MDC8002974.1 TIGR04283 family arsenosugar biosynthesis glycosyltransferase [Aureisphaera galaxeae]